MAGGQPIVQGEELTRRFGAELAVDRLSFSVGPGSIFGIFGHNAAGKSTTLRLLSGQLAPSAGRALVLGREASQHAAALRRHIGYLGQRVPLYPERTLLHNLRLFGDVRGLSRAECEGRFFELCERLDIDLATVGSQPAGRLAQGVQRRACLAFAFLHRPELLLLDEPTSGVDEHAQLRLWEVLQEAAAAGTCVVLTSHHPEEAEYCERLLLLDRGRQVLCGTVPEIKARHVGGARVRIEAPGERLQLVMDRLHGLGYRLEWTSRPGSTDVVRVFLDDYSEGPLQRLRALLRSLPGAPAMRLDLPTMEQVFREALEGRREPP